MRKLAFLMAFILMAFVLLSCNSVDEDVVEPEETVQPEQPEEPETTYMVNGIYYQGDPEVMTEDMDLVDIDLLTLAIDYTYARENDEEFIRENTTEQLLQSDMYEDIMDENMKITELDYVNYMIVDDEHVNIIVRVFTEDETVLACNYEFVKTDGNWLVDFFGLDT